MTWLPEDETCHTLETQGDSKTLKRLRVGARSGKEPFDSIEETVNVVGSNPGLEPITEGCKGLSRGSLFTV